MKLPTALGWKGEMRRVMIRACLLAMCFWSSSVSISAEAQDAALAPKDSNVQRTRTFRVPLDFAVGESAMNRLKKEGVTFPEGAMAVFNPATSQLVVKNTEANLKKVEGIVEAAVMVLPDLRISASVIEAEQTFGVQGQVIPEAEVPKFLAAVRSQEGAKFLPPDTSIPGVIAPLGKHALIEMLRTDGDKDRRKFVGIRIGVDSQPLDQHWIGARVSASVGEEGGNSLDLDRARATPVDWSNVHLFGAEAEQRVASGDMMVLHIPTAAKPLTVLVMFQAILRTGREAADFEKVNMIQEVARAAAEARKQIQMSVRVVDVPLQEEEKADLLQIGLSVFNTPPPAPDPNQAPDPGMPLSKNYGATGVLTKEQFEVFVRALNQRHGSVSSAPPSVTVKNEKEVAFEIPKEQGGGKVKIVPTVGADGLTLTLDCILGGLKDLPEKRITVTIWDGCTLILGGMTVTEEGKRLARILFITGQREDAAKAPIQK